MNVMVTWLVRYSVILVIIILVFIWDFIWVIINIEDAKNELSLVDESDPADEEVRFTLRIRPILITDSSRMY